MHKQGNSVALQWDGALSENSFMLPKEEKEFEKWECLTGDKSRITGYNLYITGDIRQGQYGRRKCKAKVVGKAGLVELFQTISE